MVSIKFLGAAGTVTGSKYLLKTPQLNILIDCGLFQGVKFLRLRNWEPLPVPVSEIDMVLITHAHLDHIGYLPLLSKLGYKGSILMTPPTRDLAEIILRDSAEIQEEDAERANRIGYSKHKPAIPLYTVKDAEAVIRQFEIIEDDKWTKLSPETEFRFVKNGHIIGSAFIEMNCLGKKIVFSGDLGRKESELMRAPSTVSDCDYLIMESTYGDRNHKPVSAHDELAEVINETIQSKGNLLIPSFAVGRAQELMHIINELKKEIRIPDIPVYMDSPMGASATKVLSKFPDWHKLSPSQCDAVFKNINIIVEYKQTLRVIDDKSIKIVIAASGMLTGGRVLDYLRQYIGEKQNTVLLVGYQAEGTRGRTLRSGAPEIKLFGKYYSVEVQVREISTLSAHADQTEMLEWMDKIIKRPEKVFLTHGENAARDAFRMKIADKFKIEATLPMQNEEFTLF